MNNFALNGGNEVVKAAPSSSATLNDISLRVYPGVLKYERASELTLSEVRRWKPRIFLRLRHPSRRILRAPSDHRLELTLLHADHACTDFARRFSLDLVRAGRNLAPTCPIAQLIPAR